ncbi:Os12g0192900 [Oryza sativa Japonica Group]|jgi:hypothetical protein|uniref:Os12g0192900 protein n=6 Tax=Oryza TaxID=4527 RepID=Q2QWK2_ORYSJ|nr:hypothetical protein LOC_Os12g09070 [Oryza sativa Japonica Group]EAY82522.1 hypothetical protein OsI_37746 [Oryza sativa Indica Group]EAZ19901.1 hypothetical protein OsJ_35494 [Oryza sativa Japonica Group]KAF2906996.1 hypothetical protein DAI22_12g062600 [Oryza sativa Japonica Group]BAT16219.1 Os12g0192900 [Oryza sativa Japonica Group]
MSSWILPSCFFPRRSAAAIAAAVVPVATKEELLELERRLWDIAPAAAYELQKRRHWTPEQVAREAEKNRWIAEKKRRIEKESKRQQRRRNSGDSAAATTTVLLDGAGVNLDKVLGEDFERKRFYEEIRLQAETRRRATPEEEPSTAAVVVTEEDDEESDDDDVPARGEEGYLERRREILGRYCLTPAHDPAGSRADIKIGEEDGGSWSPFLIARNLGRRITLRAAD